MIAPSTLFTQIIRRGAMMKFRDIKRGSIVLEDLRILQKKITGRSVYKNIAKVYRRIPKHKVKIKY